MGDYQARGDAPNTTISVGSCSPLAAATQPPSASSATDVSRQAPLTRPGLTNKPIQRDVLFWIALLYATAGAVTSAVMLPAVARPDLAWMLNAVFLGATTPLVLFALVLLPLAGLRLLWRLATWRRRIRRRSPAASSSPMWLLDPIAAPQLRFWDGHYWTNDIAGPEQPQRRSWGWWVLLGVAGLAFVLALVVPLIRPVGGPQAVGLRGEGASLAEIEESLGAVETAMAGYASCPPPDLGDPYEYRQDVLSCRPELQAVADAQMALSTSLEDSQLAEETSEGLDVVTLDSYSRALGDWVDARNSYTDLVRSCSGGTPESMANCLVRVFTIRESRLINTEESLRSVSEVLQQRLEQHGSQ